MQILQEVTAVLGKREHGKCTGGGAAELIEKKADFEVDFGEEIGLTGLCVDVGSQWYLLKRKDGKGRKLDPMF